jgi:hypothetical protein
MFCMGFLFLSPNAMVIVKIMTTEGIYILMWDPNYSGRLLSTLPQNIGLIKFWVYGREKRKAWISLVSNSSSAFTEE